MGEVAGQEEWAVGAKITLRTIFDEEVSGTVFAHDPDTASLVLQQPGSHGGVATLRMLAGAAVKEVLSLAPPPGGEGAAAPLPFVDRERARQRELKALRQAEVDLAQVGVGVTKEAQSIFDALNKTMPCVWAGRDIVVMDDVTVPPPYTPEAAAAQNANGRIALPRIVTVLTNARAQLGLAA